MDPHLLLADNPGMNFFLTISNATKANVIALVNSLFGVLIAFNIVFTQTQMGAIDIFLNAVLALAVGLTYKQSATRIDSAK